VICLAIRVSPLGDGESSNYSQMRAERSRLREMKERIFGLTGPRGNHGEDALLERVFHKLLLNYFRGDTGALLGDSHPSGWTGLVASQIGKRAVDMNGRDKWSPAS